MEDESNGNIIRVTDRPTLPVLLDDEGGFDDTRLGESLGVYGSSVFYAGGPETGFVTNVGQVDRYTRSGNSWSESSTLSSPNQQVNGGFGEKDSITVSGDRALFGAPNEGGSTGVTYLHDASSGAYLNLALRPYRFDSVSNNMLNDTTDNRQFGVGSSIISEGHYVVGSNPTTTLLDQLLYNYRRRGPAWSETSSITAPTRLETAKLGTSIAVDGNTAIVGARDYDGRGGAFIYVQNAPDDWSEPELIQPTDILLGDDFGTSVAISGDTAVVGAPDARKVYCLPENG